MIIWCKLSPFITIWARYTRSMMALEALLLNRADLKDTLFIAISNYYYDEKDSYRNILHNVGESQHDLTEFLRFGLRGIALQCQRLLREIRRHVNKSLYRDVMAKMYGRLMSTRKRALAERQLRMLERLLDIEANIAIENLYTFMNSEYAGLSDPAKAFIRDLNHLTKLRAIAVNRQRVPTGRHPWSVYSVAIRLEWPTEITETAFFEEINALPQAKTRLLVA
jgi:hypothetical protein